VNWSKENRLPDPLLDEIRAIKQAISAEFDHDVRKLGEHLKREQEASGRKIIRKRPTSRSSKKAE